MTSAAQSLTLPDGRELEYLTGGAGDGFPLVFPPGTPSAAVVDPSLWAAAERADLRLVTCSRPGYGASTPRPTPVGWPVPLVADTEDTAALLDHLGIGTSSRWVTPVAALAPWPAPPRWRTGA